MTQTQFFTREDTNIEQYKNDFIKALLKVKTVKLFPDEVIIFLETWISAQKSYIPRSDIDNFWMHLNRIFTDELFYNFIVEKLKTVQNNWKIQEYSFNLISCLDDSSSQFEASEKKRKISQNLEINKEQSKQEDEKEMQKILSAL